VVAGVVQRMAIPCKTEKTRGEGVSGVAKWLRQGERGHTGCSPAIEGLCGSRAWWWCSASMTEETGDRSWAIGRPKSWERAGSLSGVGGETGVEEVGGGR
jgi:hypothetical protein